MKNKLDYKITCPKCLEFVEIQTFANERTVYYEGYCKKCNNVFEVSKLDALLHLQSTKCSKPLF